MKRELRRKRGALFMGLFAAFIAGGIIAKRVYYAPALVPAFHLPAAVFLVLAFYELSADLRAKRKEALARNRVLS